MRGGLYVPFHEKAKHAYKSLRAKFNGNVRLEWVPRARNGECDVLSKSVLKERGIRFRIQPEA